MMKRKQITTLGKYCMTTFFGDNPKDQYTTHKIGSVHLGNHFQDGLLMNSMVREIGTVT
jgi:hypothetical protein